MSKAKKQKIITLILSVLILGGCIVFVLTQIHTGKDTAPENTVPDSSVAGYTVYTMPPGYTAAADPGLVITYPEDLSVTSEESMFAFAGTCGKEYPLLCNGSPVDVTDRGTFSAEYKLSLGENRFVFKYGDTVKEYTVTYNINVLTQVAPTGQTEMMPGNQIEILALAYKDAVVTAKIAGQMIPMNVTEGNAFGQSEGTRDYKTFSCIFTAPAVGQSTSLGLIEVTGSYGGQSVTMNGGELFVYSDISAIYARAEQIEQNMTFTSYYDSGTHGLLTPFSDNGLGISQLCEILKDKAETTDAADITDNSSIFFSPLARGTFDYVTGAVAYEDELMYVLASGRKVYAKEARFISGGFVLPANRISAVDAVAGENTTDLFVSTVWAVPTSMSVGPQGYYTGYQNRPFNVSSFTAEYLDITFYHTSECGGKFRLPDNKLFSSVDWINNGNGSVTLRCRLVETGKFCGCSVDLTEDGRFRISVKNTVKKQRIVVIDAGHGGNDPGALAIFPGVQEQMINFALATRVASLLEANGIRVIMTRVGDEAHSLNERMLTARTYKPDAFVAIHSDYASNAAISGTHAFYYYPWSMNLAECVHRHMVNAYRSSIYPPGTAEYESADRGVKFYPFQVTRVEECPSILIESGFVSNVSDCSVLLTPTCQDILASSIANGIIEFLNTRYK